jgi:hypothetical protein
MDWPAGHLGPPWVARSGQPRVVLKASAVPWVGHQWETQVVRRQARPVGPLKAQGWGVWLDRAPGLLGEALQPAAKAQPREEVPQGGLAAAQPWLALPGAAALVGGSQQVWPPRAAALWGQNEAARSPVERRIPRCTPRSALVLPRRAPWQDPPDRRSHNLGR